jgi:hypothetical protein
MDETLPRSWARRLVLSIAMFWGFLCIGVIFLLWYPPLAFFLTLIPAGAAGFYVFRTALEPCRTETGESAWRLLFVPSVTYRHYPAVQDALSDTFRPRVMVKVLRSTGWNPAVAGGLLVLLLATYLALLALVLVNGPPRWE